MVHVTIWTLCAISCLFVVYFSLPPTLAALSDSHESCKMKATALLHVTPQTLPFLFLRPQTPDFYDAKNRLLQTLTPPPCCPLTSSFFPLLYRLLLGGLSTLGPFFPYMWQTKPHGSIHSGLPLCERDVRIFYKIDRRFLVFIFSGPDKKIPR